MGKRGHSEEEILRVLREAESWETVVDVNDEAFTLSGKTFSVAPPGTHPTNDHQGYFAGRLQGQR
jgi:hypothetical protein